jgi:hypothetical protein
VRDNEFCGGIQDTGSVRMTLSKAHGKLGHISFQKNKTNCKSMGWTLTGSVKVCEACAEGKDRQKNIIVKATKRSDSMQNDEFTLILALYKIVSTKILHLNHTGE